VAEVRLAEDTAEGIYRVFEVFGVVSGVYYTFFDACECKIQFLGDAVEDCAVVMRRGLELGGHVGDVTGDLGDLFVDLAF
jgi:hypothetical protein